VRLCSWREPMDIHVQRTEAMRDIVLRRVAHVRELLAGPLARTRADSDDADRLHRLLEVLQATGRWAAHGR